MEGRSLQGSFGLNSAKIMVWPFRSHSSIGVDLGTANTLMYVSGKGIVLDEPSVVALDVERGVPVEVGAGAKRMIGKTPKSIQAIRPLRDGVIADYAAAELMMQTFMRRGNAGKVTAPRMVVGIPSSITDVERRAVREAGIIGSKEVYLIDETVAAAIGAGLPVTEPVGSMIVDIGGGTTDVAVLSLGSPVASESVRIAGDEITESIAGYLKKKYGLVIGESTAEKVKMQVGSAHVNANCDDRHMEVSGFNSRTGLPESITVTALEIRGAIEEPLRAIVESIKRVLEQTPPELAADVHARGIVLAGGGALIPGISDLITESTGIFAVVADDPLHCVVNGCGQVLEDWENLKRCTCGDVS